MNDNDKQSTINTESTYSYLQKVKIINGFYKGRVGKIQSYKNKQYEILVIIDEKKHYIIVKESDIKNAELFTK